MSSRRRSDSEVAKANYGHDGNDQGPRRAIVVLGTGRSGTSLLMQALRASGANVPSSTVPISDANLRGTGEDVRVRDLFNELHASLGNKATFRQAGWMDTEAAAAALRQLADYLSVMATPGGAPLAIKYPLSSLYIPLYQAAAELSGTELQFVWATRSLGSTLRSMEATYGYGPSVARSRCTQRLYYILRDSPKDTPLLAYERWTIDFKGMMSEVRRVCGCNDESEHLETVFSRELDRSSADQRPVNGVLGEVDQIISRSRSETVFAHEVQDLATQLALATDLYSDREFRDEYGKWKRSTSTPEDNIFVMRLQRVAQSVPDRSLRNELSAIAADLDLSAKLDATAQNEVPTSTKSPSAPATKLVSKEDQVSDRQVVDGFRSLAQTAMREVEVLRGRNLELRDESTAASKAKKDLQTEITRLAAEVDNLQDELKQATAVSGKELELKTSYAALTQAYDLLDEKMRTELSARQSAWESDTTRLKLRIADLEVRIESLQSQVVRLKNRLKRVEVRETWLKTVTESLEKSARDSIQILSPHNRVVKPGKPIRAGRMLDKTVAETVAARRSERAESEELREELERIKSSRSWRITRPLRSAAGVMRISKD